MNSQPLIVGVPGMEAEGAFLDLVKDIQPGGFILFARNLSDPTQTFKLMQTLRKVCEEPPIFTIDQEGGRVARLDRLGTSSPSAADLALKGDPDLCRRHGELTGELLSLFGFNLNLAPVVDFRTLEERDNSLRGRCFGTSPEEVIARAGAFLEGMESQGVQGTLKHFPGYTYCGSDPHGRIPKVTRSRKEIMGHEWEPYRQLLSGRRAVMVGHAHFTAWHADPLPASLSREIVHTGLRDDLKFDGLVMTDDLEMGSIAQTYPAATATRRAIEAGNDMVLICHNPACYFLAAESLDQIDAAPLQSAQTRIARWKKDLPAPPRRFVGKRFEAILEEIKTLRTKATQS